MSVIIICREFYSKCTLLPVNGLPKTFHMYNLLMNNKNGIRLIKDFEVLKMQMNLFKAGVCCTRHITVCESLSIMLA